jgi:hypothetical protein
MRLLHGLMSRLNIATTMINQILECSEDRTQWLTENGDTLKSDEPSSQIVWMNHQAMPM